MSVNKLGFDPCTGERSQTITRSRRFIPSQGNVEAARLSACRASFRASELPNCARCSLQCLLMEWCVSSLASLAYLWPMLKRLEDRIKDLCAKVVETPASPQLDILEQLQAALSEHTQRMRMRKMVAVFPTLPMRRSDDID
jgi:hypothetical protein